MDSVESRETSRLHVAHSLVMLNLEISEPYVLLRKVDGSTVTAGTSDAFALCNSSHLDFELPYKPRRTCHVMHLVAIVILTTLLLVRGGPGRGDRDHPALPDVGASNEYGPCLVLTFKLIFFRRGGRRGGLYGRKVQSQKSVVKVGRDG